jgi:hypothetical protein
MGVRLNLQCSALPPGRADARRDHSHARTHTHTYTRARTHTHRDARTHTHVYTHIVTRAHSHRDAHTRTSQRMARVCAAHHVLVDAITHRSRARHRARPLPKDHNSRLPLNHSARLRFQRRRRQLDRRCRRHSRGRGRLAGTSSSGGPSWRRSGIGARRRGALLYSTIRCSEVRWRNRARCAR